MCVYFSCGPGLSEKVSRKAILDKSLNCPVVVDEEDIWFSTSKLFLVTNITIMANPLLRNIP